MSGSAAKLRKIGIEIEGKHVYEPADGTAVELPILGVAALESTGISPALPACPPSPSRRCRRA